MQKIIMIIPNQHNTLPLNLSLFSCICITLLQWFGCFKELIFEFPQQKNRLSLRIFLEKNLEQCSMTLWHLGGSNHRVSLWKGHCSIFLLFKKIFYGIPTPPTLHIRISEMIICPMRLVLFDVCRYINCPFK